MDDGAVLEPPDPHDRYTNHLEAKDALSILAAVPERRRRVKTLHVLGFKYEEISQILGVGYTRANALQVEAAAAIRKEQANQVDVQWNVKTASFTEPKYGPYTIALVDHAKKRLLTVPRDAAYVFTTLRGTHYTPSSRNHHWNRVRASAGLGNMTLYLATRHYFGYYALNILELEPSVIAVQLGHRDGGRLVEQLYGHRDKRKSLAKIRQAFLSGPSPTASHVHARSALSARRANTAA